MPTMPPTSVSVAASTRNCHRISRRVAPSALRTPISRVRSVTEIIMIALTPHPPTSSPTAERASITMRTSSVVLLRLSRNFSWLTTAKLLSWPGRRCRRRRSASVTSSIACAVVAAGAGPTRKSIHPFQYCTYFTSAACGMIASGDGWPPNSCGGGLNTPNTALEEPAHPEGPGPGLLEHVGDALVEAADDRADHHHDHDPDRDAQNRQGGARFVGAQRLQRDADAFEQGGQALTPVAAPRWDRAGTPGWPDTRPPRCRPRRRPRRPAGSRTAIRRRARGSRPSGAARARPRSRSPRSRPPWRGPRTRRGTGAGW